MKIVILTLVVHTEPVLFLLSFLRQLPGKRMNIVSALPVSLLSFWNLVTSFLSHPTTVSFRSDFHIANGSEQLICSCYMTCLKYLKHLTFFGIFFIILFGSPPLLVFLLFLIYFSNNYLWSAYSSPFSLGFYKVLFRYLCTFCITSPTTQHYTLDHSCGFSDLFYIIMCHSSDLDLSFI